MYAGYIQSFDLKPYARTFPGHKKGVNIELLSPKQAGLKIDRSEWIIRKIIKAMSHEEQEKYHIKKVGNNWIIAWYKETEQYFRAKTPGRGTRTDLK